MAQAGGAPCRAGAWAPRRLDGGGERAEMLGWETNVGAGVGHGTEPRRTHHHFWGWGAATGVCQGRGSYLHRASELA